MRCPSCSAVMDAKRAPSGDDVLVFDCPEPECRLHFKMRATFAASDEFEEHPDRMPRLVAYIREQNEKGTPLIDRNWQELQANNQPGSIAKLISRKE